MNMGEGRRMRIYYEAGGATWKSWNHGKDLAQPAGGAARFRVTRTGQRVRIEMDGREWATVTVAGQPGHATVGGSQDSRRSFRGDVRGVTVTGGVAP
jgi:hypothetical protein